MIASLGNAGFRRAYDLRYAYLAGAMYKGIASKELVVAMGRAGMLGYLGAGGLSLAEIDAAIQHIQGALGGDRYGVNLLHQPEQPELEDQTVELLLARGVRYIEAAAFMHATPSLVRWRLTGLRRDASGAIARPRRTLAKVSRPEVATAFLSPAPPAIVAALVAAGKVTRDEAALGAELPLADELCVEADSAGHTDQGVAYALMPAMLALRDRLVAHHGYRAPVWVGAAGGIGTPHAAAAALIMGADFVLTGSINQCTVEAGTSDAVKAVLQDVDVQDTEYAPAGDMFELGAQVQVVRRGLFFPARARKLYELYRRHDAIEDIDPRTRVQIEDRYFRRSFADVWAETRAHYARTRPDKLAAIEADPKRRMALIFRWYFVHASRLARAGSVDQRVDYQIHCGPAMGSFNQWVKGTELEAWPQRRVADLGERIMRGAAALLEERYRAMTRGEERDE